MKTILLRFLAGAALAFVVALVLSPKARTVVLVSICAGVAVAGACSIVSNRA